MGKPRSRPTPLSPDAFGGNPTPFLLLPHGNPVLYPICFGNPQYKCGPITLKTFTFLGVIQQSHTRLSMTVHLDFIVWMFFGRTISVQFVFFPNRFRRAILRPLAVDTSYQTRTITYTNRCRVSCQQRSHVSKRLAVRFHCRGVARHGAHSFDEIF